MRPHEATVEIVRTTIERYDMFNPGDVVVVGCSGGVDSVCLLHILTIALNDFHLNCIAVYVDHSLRRHIAKERDLVRNLAVSLGATFETAEVDVAARIGATGESTQDAARNLRYDALESIRREFDARRIAVGHTKSDQAETVMLQILRGAGPKGLAGISPVYDRVVRPMIGLSRSQVESYCYEHKLDFVTDPSNNEDVYVRNRVRRHVLPLLRRVNPGVENHLARVADILGEEERWLETKVDHAIPSLISLENGDGGVIRVIDVSRLNSLPLGFRRRIVRRAVALVRGDEKGLEFSHVEAIINAAQLTRRPGRPATFEIGTFGGVRVMKEYGNLLFLSITTRLNRPPVKTRLINAPGEVILTELNLTLSADVCGATEDNRSVDDDERKVARFDRDLIAPPIKIRSRKPGDVIHMAGGRRKKVKDILIDAQVPSRLRETIPIITDNEGVLWVVGHAISDRASPGSDTMKILELTFRSNG